MTLWLSSILLCGGQPAIGPTSGFLAFSYKLFASVSSHGRRINLSVFSIKIVLLYYILFKTEAFYYFTSILCKLFNSDEYIVDICCTATGSMS